MARLLNGVCLALVALCVALFAYTLPRLEFDNDLLALFPDASDYRGQGQADQLLAERMTRKVFLLLGSDDYAATQAAAPQVAAALETCDCFEQAQLRVDAEADVALHRHYAEHLPFLLTPEHRTVIAAGREEQLSRQALRRLLTDPGPGLAETLAADPLGTLRAYRQWARPPLRGVQLDDQGYPMVQLEGRRYVLLQADLADSPYGLALQESARDVLARALEPFKGLSGAQVLKTGALFYTLSGSDQARQEISTVGLGSLIGICLLLLAVFRSPTLLLLAFAPIGLGVAAGVTATYWLFGSVHVIALVFGASLVGVAIDYSLHFFTRRHSQGPDWQPERGLRHLLAPLSLGLLTSVAGYLSFTAAGFPGFSQIAIFSAAGLVSAYAVVVGLYPHLLARPPRRLPGPFLARGLEAWRACHWRVARVPAWPLVAAALVLGGVLTQVRVNDDIRQMQLPDPALTSAEEQFRGALGERTDLQYLLVEAPTRQALLERLETLGETLDAQVAAGTLAGYQSPAQLLPSLARQEDNRRLWEGLVTSGALAQVWDQLGVSGSVREQLQARLATADPMTWADTWPLIQALPDAPGHFSEGGHHYGTVSLRGLEDSEALANAVAPWDFVQWVDPVARTNALLSDYRRAAALLLLLAYLGIGLLLTWRYGWRGALAAVAPPALASLGSLAVLTLFGQSISVFNIMALLLVLGIGIDYTLFLRESRGRGWDTLLAIGLSTLTTVLSFGLLSLSATTAIASFGATLLLGIVFGFALAPLALKPVSGATTAPFGEQ